VASGAEREPHEQLERVRHALRDQIGHDLMHEGALNVHRLDPLIEDAVREAIVRRGPERTLALAPDLARDIVQAAKRTLANSPGGVVLTQAELRRLVFEVLSPELPDTAVISYDELAPSLPVQQRAPIRI
jgi:type III secretory pathway component EscV